MKEAKLLAILWAIFQLSPENLNKHRRNGSAMEMEKFVLSVSFPVSFTPRYHALNYQSSTLRWIYPNLIVCIGGIKMIHDWNQRSKTFSYAHNKFIAPWISFNLLSFTHSAICSIKRFTKKYSLTVFDHKLMAYRWIIDEVRKCIFITVVLNTFYLLLAFIMSLCVFWGIVSLSQLPHQ